MSTSPPMRRSLHLDCPDPETLRAFAIGDMSEDRLETIAAHVDACEVCARALEGEDGLADELVSSLRHLTPGAAEEDAVAEPLVAAASELIVDRGRGIARQVAIGPYTLGRFVLLEQVGAGSFGYVFRAKDTELDRIVAVKIQRASQLASVQEGERFLREARSAAQLEHPAIVSLYETGQTDDGTCYLVTEFVAGQTLEKRLADTGFSFADTARLVADIALALQYAHEHGVIHRDVKPSNIVVDRDGRPHVMDFGLAKREVGEVTVTPSGELLGTPAYMSPEIARGESHDVDGRSDVFSLGVVLYELLTGARPFQGNRRMLVQQVLEEDPRPPHRLEERVPRDLETICLKALAKSPVRRYASAGDFAADLQRFLAGEPITARRIGRVERLWRWGRRYPLAVSLFALVIFGSAIGYWYLSDLSRDLIRRAAIESSEQYAALLEVANDVYTTEVIDRIGSDGAVEASIPLPATMMIMLLDRIGESDSGMSGRQYSDYPFKFRTDGGPRDPFERAAVDAVTVSPERPFYRFTELRGRPMLRYARARIMKSSCVACHNTHPQSPKLDWSIGDVRGVLEIQRPLATDTLRTERALRGSFVLIGALSVVLLLTALLTLVFARRR